MRKLFLSYIRDFTIQDKPKFRINPHVQDVPKVRRIRHTRHSHTKQLPEGGHVDNTGDNQASPLELPPIRRSSIDVLTRKAPYPKLPSQFPRPKAIRKQISSATTTPIANPHLKLPVKKMTSPNSFKPPPTGNYNNSSIPMCTRSIRRGTGKLTPNLT